jgi:hypothetical protein
MAIGIRVLLTNGGFDWYDPVEHDKYYVDEEGTLHIDNGHYEYTLNKDEYQSYDTYQLCPICGREVGTCSCDED